MRTHAINLTDSHNCLIFNINHFCSFKSSLAKLLNDSDLHKVPYEEATVVYDNEPGPDKYVSNIIYTIYLIGQFSPGLGNNIRAFTSCRRRTLPNNSALGVFRDLEF